MRVERVSRSEAQKLLKAQKARPHKYRAKAVVVDGLRFDSKREAARWGELRILERLGQISELRHHVVYRLHAPVMAAGKKRPIGIVEIARYESDFTYLKGTETVVEDVKGMAGLPLYRLKAKHLAIEYGLTVAEVR